MDARTASALADAAENFFFTPATMRAFNSRVLDSTWTEIDANTFRFITSERFDDAPRMYTVREMTLAPFEVVTIGDHYAYTTSTEARRHLKD